MTIGLGEAAASRAEALRGDARLLPMPARILLLLAAVAAAGLYLQVSSRMYRVFRWADDISAENLKRAARLQPSDAELRYRMGRYSLLMQDFPKAIADLKAAIALNPYEARYWLDLANALLASDDSPGARQALARAIEADPTTPEVVWQAANYELVGGDTASAMHRFHGLVENDPDSLLRVLNVCWRATRDPELITEKVLPARPEAHLAFIRFLIAKGEPDAATRAWSHLIELKRPFPLPLAFPYLEYLISHGQPNEAATAWAQLAVANPEFRAYVPPDNQIVNGGFELDLLNGGLDWRYSSKPGASVIIDVNRAHGGRRSLAISLDGAPEDSGVFQLIPVRSNTRYQFSAFMMVEGLETVSPPRFSVLGLRGSKRYVLTEGATGSTGWREFQGEFTTTPQDDLLLVSIVRVPSRPLIRGRVWVDDVTLVARP